MNNGIERPFARGPAGTSVANWIDASSAYEFRLYSATTPRALLASVKVRIASAITASPNPVPAGPGPGSTTITWTTRGGPDGLVWVSTDGGIERSFGRGKAGTSVANWINSSSAYEFRLYSATTPRTLLASVKVTRARSSSAAPPTPPSIEASPTPVPAGPGLRPTTITWTTGDGSDGLVYVSTDGGTRQIFTQGPFGSLVANWIDDRSAYEFELSSNTTPQTLLAAVKVPARPAARVPAEPSSEPTPQNVTAVRARSYLAASPNPVPAGLGAGATEISWAVGAGTGKILMSVDGAPATQFAAGTGGSLQATPIRAGSIYEFRLYGAGTPDVLFASIVVTRGSLYPFVLAAAAVVLLLSAVILVRRSKKSAPSRRT